MTPASTDVNPVVHSQTSTRTLVTGNGVATVVHEKQPLGPPSTNTGDQPPPYSYTLIPAARGEPISLQPATPYVSKVKRN